MKLSLVVLAAGPQQGKVLEIKQPQFVVGRDPDCQLRPASPLISKRHCALLQREGKVFVQDFGSTNGTSVNDQPVKGEIELNNDDRLKIGPLLFGVRIEADPASAKAAPPPAKAPPKAAPAPAKAGGKAAPAPAKAAPAPAKAGGKAAPAPAKAAPAPAKAAPAAEAPAAAKGEDDDIAAMLLSLHDEGDTGSPAEAPEVPEGATLMEIPLAPGQQPSQADKDKGKEKKEDPKSTKSTSSDAAKNLLEKYMKRPRG
jgi:predicted component of type VI protein secretion system